MRHAPRERVSWNILIDEAMNEADVTLHVSVWVEIRLYVLFEHSDSVTLHVSVWVEI